MKKTFYIIGAALALVACAKEAPVVEETVIDASKLSFQFEVNQIDNADTKAVKAAWASGDVVYVFFEDNTTNYIKMVYGGSAWTCLDKDGGVDFAGLTLSESGKKLTAVYLPYNTDAPAYDEGWTFADTYSYYLTSGAVSYTVNTGVTPNVVTATLNMTKPSGFVQFYLPDSSPVAGKYALLESHITPKTCGKIIGGTAIEPVAKTAGYKMPCNVVTTGTAAEKGYYFYGTIASSITDNFNFSLVEIDPTHKCAIGTQSLALTGKTLSTDAAVKFTTAFSAQEPWVDLGLSVKWATGNLADDGTDDVAPTSGWIAAPNELGKWYAWGELRGYAPAVAYGSNADFGHVFNTYRSGYVNGEYLIAEHDAATQFLGSSWRMPTKAELSELVSGCSVGNYSVSTNEKYTTLIGNNGIKIMIRNQGWVYHVKIEGVFVDRLYDYNAMRIWSGTFSAGENAFRWNGSAIGHAAARYGMALRPVFGSPRPPKN